MRNYSSRLLYLIVHARHLFVIAFLRRATLSPQCPRHRTRCPYVYYKLLTFKNFSIFIQFKKSTIKPRNSVNNSSFYESGSQFRQVLPARQCRILMRRSHPPVKFAPLGLEKMLFISHFHFYTVGKFLKNLQDRTNISLCLIS